ncbi:hypothetical protein AB0368_34885 [Actinoplanes sp. NPDC051475]|uniref:hypothetical protein n=1 Tax=Actinoplanes sp. NPDC051475 TaxID=3157225 RepID=UPI00344DC7BB
MYETVIADAVHTPISRQKRGGTLSEMGPTGRQGQALRERDTRFGLQVTCEVGGPSSGTIIERLG